MGNALFYGACGFAILIGTSCLGVIVGKFLQRNRRLYTYEEMDGVEGQWSKEPPS